jgi:sulfite dehydrogenase (cytochrome) subunit B
MTYAHWALALVLVSAAAHAEPRAYTLPEETATLAAGPHLETMQENCASCHSAEYISTQPRNLANPRAFWMAEVVKMQKAYGAPVADADVPAIVDYLVQTYGTAGSGG